MTGGMCAFKSDKNHLAPNWDHCDLIASLFLLFLRTAGSCLARMDYLRGSERPVRNLKNT